MKGSSQYWYSKYIYRRVEAYSKPVREMVVNHVAFRKVFSVTPCRKANRTIKPGNLLPKFVPS
jgi:hypothetical protein